MKHIYSSMLLLFLALCGLTVGKQSNPGPESAVDQPKRDDSQQSRTSEDTRNPSETPWQTYVKSLKSVPKDTALALAAKLINAGLLSETRDVLDLHFSAGPENRREVNALACLLYGKTYLLEYEMGRDVQVFDGPAAQVKKQLTQLDVARKTVKIGLEVLEQDRTALGADSYVRLRSLLLTLEARILVARGDVGYRLQGPTLLAQRQGEVTDSIALAEYGIARQRLYEALLIEKNVAGMSLARDLDDRIRWLLDGRAFGGQVFFEVDPVMGSLDGEEWTPLAELKRLLDEKDGALMVLEQTRADKLNENKGKAQATATEFRKQLNERQQNKINQKEKLAMEVFKLQTDIAAIKGTKAKEKVTQLQSQVVNSGLNKILNELQQSEKAKLQKKLDEVEIALNKALGDLGELVSEPVLTELLVFESTGQQHAALRKNQAPDTFVKALRKFIDESKSEPLKRTWSRVKDAVGTELQKAAEQVSQAQADLGIVGKQIEISAVEVKSQLEKIGQLQIQAGIKAVDEQIDKLRKEILDADMKIADGVEAVQKQIHSALKQQIEDEKRHVETKIAEVKNRIENLLKQMNNIRSLGDQAQQVLLAARAAILAAGDIPSGIITGMSSGIITNRGGALVEAAKTGAEVVRQGLVVIEKIEDAKARLEQVRSSIDDYGAKMKQLDGKLLEQELKHLADELTRRVTKEKKKLEQDILARQAEAHRLISKVNASAVKIAQLGKDRLELGIAREKAVKSKIESVIREKVNDLERVKRKALNQAAAVEILLNQAANCYSVLKGMEFAQEEDKKIKEKEKKETLEARIELQGAEDHQVKVLFQKILELQKRADAGENMPTLPVPIEELTGLGNGASQEELTREFQKQLDRANYLLFQFANWLYLITRDPEALEWAIQCNRVSEAKIAFERLYRIYQRTQGEIGRARPRYFAVEFSQKDLVHFFPRISQAGPGGGEAYFTIAPQLAGLNVKKPIVENELGDEPFNVYPALPYDSPSAADVNQAELVAAPLVEVELGVHQILWDAWVVPTWQDAEKVPTTLRQIGLEPVGPTQFLRGDRIETMPVRAAKFPSFSSTSFDPKRLEAQHRGAIARLAAGDATKSLLDGTLHGMNYRQILGRGLGNTWRLVLPKAWSRYEDQAPPFSDLQKVRIVFGYLSSPVRLPVTALVKKDGAPSAKLPIDVPSPSVAKTAWTRLQDNYQRYMKDLNRADLKRRQFADSPAAQLDRIRMLQDAFELLPDYSDMYNSNKPAESHLLDPTKTKFLAWVAGASFPPHTPSARHPDSNMAGTITYLVASPPGQELFLKVCVPLPESELVRLLEQQARRIIDEEMLRFTPTESLVGPIEIGGIWDEMKIILGTDKNSDKSTLWREVYKKRREIEASAATLEKATVGLEMIERMVQRVVYDYRVSLAQQRLLKDIPDWIHPINPKQEKDVRTLAKQVTAALNNETGEDTWVRDIALDLTNPKLADLAKKYLVYRRLLNLRQEYFDKVLNPISSR